MATLLIKWSGNDLAPAWYLVAAALVTLVAFAFARETCKEPLRHE
jgi:MHS family proline/betaine transporter-like MFS transporter